MSHLKLRCLGGPWHGQLVEVSGHAREVEVPGRRDGHYVRWPDGPGERAVALTWVVPDGNGGWERLSVREEETR